MGCLFITVIIPIINEFLTLLGQSLDWVKTKIAIATARNLAKAQEENLNLDLDEDEEEDEEKIPFGFHAEPVEQESAIGIEIPSEEEYEDDDWCDDRGGRKKK